MKSTPRERCASAVLACLAVVLVAQRADAAEGLAPTKLFVQAGAAEDAQMLVAGAVWDWGWHRPQFGGVLTGYWEVSFGRWSSQAGPGGSSSAWVTQLGVTPVLRWHPGSAATSSWFLEAGIGANLLAPIYRNRDKRFSTTFNFGDHVAVGWRLGAEQRHEISLRVQHFSNAGIKQPNPGEDFLQLRYAARF
jgi:lipid A 3-O-deacylase